MHRFFAFLSIFFGFHIILASDNKDLYYVCDAGVVEMNGVYEKSDEGMMDGVEFYIRRDTSDYETKDFRLFRNRGHWMFADFSTWPPSTKYRCDPSKSSGIHTCETGSKQVPLSGYSIVEGISGPAPKVQNTPCGPMNDEL